MQLITKSEEIEKRIIDLRINQKIVAKDLGVTPNTVNNIVRGRNKSIATAHRIAHYLGGKLEDYFEIDYSDEKAREVRWVMRN